MIVNQTIIFRIRSSFSISRKYLSTAKAFSPISEISETRNKRLKKDYLQGEMKMPKDMKKYFESNKKENIMNAFPEKLLVKKQKTPEIIYIADKTTAKIISEHITKDLPADRPLIEVNPGAGILTQELKKMNVNDLRLFENDSFFTQTLKAIIKNKDNISLKCKDFLGLWKLSYQDILDNGSRVSEILEDVPKKEWTDSPNMRLYANIGSANFFKHLISSIALQHSLMSFGRAEMYLTLPPPVYIQLTCSQEAGYLLYRASTMLFQIMFEHEFIAKLPREHFLPWQYEYSQSSQSKLRRINSVDPESLYLVKITPRKNLFDLCALEDLKALAFFIKQNCVSRKRCIIPSLEKWAPKCGVKLILNSKDDPTIIKNENLQTKPNTFIPHLSTLSQNITKAAYYKDMNIFTQFGDLNPSEMLTLFTQFRSWPEYSQSPFLASMEHNLLKTETASDINGNVIDIIDDEEASVVSTKAIESNVKQ